MLASLNRHLAFVTCGRATHNCQSPDPQRTHIKNERRIKIPFEMRSRAPEPASSSSRLAREMYARRVVVLHRVLVLDDYPDAAFSISMLIEMLGHECRIATRGFEALELALDFEPDIAFLDLDLPDIHGFEVARRLRAMAAERPLYLAAITGSDRPDNRAQAAAAGFDQHVLKPLDTALVKLLLRRAESSFAGQLH
jgi:CheY-like chemotaxis protein